MKETVSVLVSQQDIEKRMDELAAQIMKDYEGKKIYMLCILKGGVIFMVDLARKLEMEVEFDFMDVSSYGNAMESSGRIEVRKDLQESIEGKHVLIVEDIIDTGRTLDFLIQNLKQRNPASLKICTLLDKPEQRVVDIKVDYVGFDIPNKFVIGYGLDYAQRYRNLKYIGVLKIEE